MKNRWIAALLSAVFPGLGQYVVGCRERGLAILAGWMALPALYGIIMIGVEQLARSQGFDSTQLRAYLAGRYLLWGQVELGPLTYAAVCLVLYWLLNICDAALCARDAA